MEFIKIIIRAEFFYKKYHKGYENLIELIGDYIIIIKRLILGEKSLDPENHVREL